MVFPTAVQDETLAPPLGVGTWGRALGTRLSCVINIIVCVFLPCTRLEDRPAAPLFWSVVQSKLA